MRTLYFIFIHCMNLFLCFQSLHLCNILLASALIHFTIIISTILLQICYSND